MSNFDLLVLPLETEYNSFFSISTVTELTGLVHLRVLIVNCSALNF